jgi:hypothetical protein
MSPDDKGGHCAGDAETQELQRVVVLADPDVDLPVAMMDGVYVSATTIDENAFVALLQEAYVTESGRVNVLY